MGISEGRIYWIYQRNVLYCNGNAFVFNSHTRVGLYSRILKSGFNLKLMLRGIGRRNLVSCFLSNIILLFVSSWKGCLYCPHWWNASNRYSTLIIQFLGMNNTLYYRWLWLAWFGMQMVSVFNWFVRLWNGFIILYIVVFNEGNSW